MKIVVIFGWNSAIFNFLNLRSLYQKQTKPQRILIFAINIVFCFHKTSKVLASNKTSIFWILYLLLQYGTFWLKNCNFEFFKSQRRRLSSLLYDIGQKRLGNPSVIRRYTTGSSISKGWRAANRLYLRGKENQRNKKSKKFG